MAAAFAGRGPELAAWITGDEDDELQSFKISEDSETITIEWVKRDGELRSSEINADDAIWLVDLEGALRPRVEQIVDAYDDNKEVVSAALLRHDIFLAFVSERLRGDRDVVLLAVKRVGMLNLRWASEDLRNDRDVVLAALQHDGTLAERKVWRQSILEKRWMFSSIQCASKALRGDRELALLAVQTAGSDFEILPEALRGDREFVLLALKTGESVDVSRISKDLRGDRDVAIAAASHLDTDDWREQLLLDKQPFGGLSDADLEDTDGFTDLSLFSEELRSDREIVLMAMKRDTRNFDFASETLRGDRELIRMVLEEGDYINLDRIPLNLQREFELIAVKKDGKNLQFASSNLRNDREVVTAALEHRGRNLEYASAELRNDRAIVSAAFNLREGASAVRYASKDLRSDRDFMLEVTKRWKRGRWRATGNLLQFASLELRDDRNFALAAILSGSGVDLLSASSRLREDREFVLEAVRGIPDALQHAPEDMQKDVRFVIQALRTAPPAMNYVSKELRKHPLVLQAAVHGLSEHALRRESEYTIHSKIAEVDKFLKTVLPGELPDEPLSDDFKKEVYTAVLDELDSDRSSKIENLRAENERLAALSTDQSSEIEMLRAENARLTALAAVDVLDCTGETVVTTERLPSAKQDRADGGLKAVATAAVEIKRERDAHESRAELLDTMVLPLEEQRRQLQALVTEAATALIEADVPTVELSDEQVPFYYACHSWESVQEVPWDPEKSEPMTLAEGIKWIQRGARETKRRRRS